MNRFVSLALASAAALAVPAMANAQQVVASPISASNTLLSVSGEGKSFAKPDVAVFSAGVTTQGATAAAALADNARAMDRVIAALKKAGVAERDIQTSNLSINPIYADPNRDAMMAARTSGQPYVPPPPEMQIPRIIGYSANNTVSVRHRKLNDYGAVIDTLAAAGANQINGPMFQMDEPTAALDAARRDAVKDARRKAELYASAMGLRIVRAISVSENGGYYGPPPQVFYSRDIAVAASAPPPPPPSPVAVGEMQMTANVAIQYELAQ